VEKETREKMTVLQNYFEQNRDEVLDNLLAFVCDIGRKSMKTTA
jgi:V-type H+-transporting ATPase subunit G